MGYLSEQRQSGKSLLYRGLDLLFPPRCVACKATGQPLCQQCIGSILPPPDPRCQHCSSPLEKQMQSQLCHNCQSRTSHLTIIHAISAYQGNLRTAIHALKYEGQTRLARPLGLLLAHELQTRYRPGEIDMLIPVPLHAQRLQERGYNHSLLLARICAEACGIPLDQHSLVRKRSTSAQVGLKVAERQQNVQDAFICLSKQASHPGNRARTHLIIDDVYTTGATMEACAAALKAAGASTIHGLVLACAGKRPAESRQTES